MERPPNSERPVELAEQHGHPKQQLAKPGHTLSVASTPTETECDQHLDGVRIADNTSALSTCGSAMPMAEVPSAGSRTASVGAAAAAPDVAGTEVDDGAGLASGGADKRLRSAATSTKSCAFPNPSRYQLKRAC